MGDTKESTFIEAPESLNETVTDDLFQDEPLTQDISTVDRLQVPSESRSPFQRKVSFDTISTASCSYPSTPEAPSAPSHQSNGSFFSFMNASPFGCGGGGGGGGGQSGTGSDGEEYWTASQNDCTSLKKEYSSFTVSSRHKEHRYTTGSRTFMFSLRDKEYSFRALKWCLNNLVENNDEIIILKHYSTRSEVDITSYQREANSILAHVTSSVDRSLKINVIVELAIGKIKQVAQKTLLLYQPCLVIVGVNPKTVSKIHVRNKTLSSYFIAKSAVPVIIFSPQPQKLKYKWNHSEPENRAYEYLSSMVHLIKKTSEKNDNTSDPSLSSSSSLTRERTASTSSRRSSLMSVGSGTHYKLNSDWVDEHTGSGIPTRMRTTRPISLPGYPDEYSEEPGSYEEGHQPIKLSVVPAPPPTPQMNLGRRASVASSKIARSLSALLHHRRHSMN